MPGCSPPAPPVQAKAQGAHPWYSIKNAVSSEQAELLLFDEIGGWYGTLADDFIAELKAVTAPKLLVKVNSPGGSVFEGIALANALRSHPAEVTVQVEGLAASIASVIALAGDRLIMQPNSMLMIHDASGVCLGDAADMAKMAELLDAISDNIASAYAAKAGGTAPEWREAMRAESWYSAEQAVKAGLADEVGKQRGQAEPDGDEPEMHRAFDLTAYGYQGPKQPAAGLTEDIRTLVGDEVAAALRAAAAEPAPAQPETPEPEPAHEQPAAVQGEEPPAGDEPEPAEALDDWAAAVAQLMQPAPDPWAEQVSHLIHSTSASRAATEAA